MGLLHIRQEVFGFLRYSLTNPVYHIVSICYALSMRYMGIDYGTKRVGVAFSDEGGVMAFPHSVLQNDAGLETTLVALAQKDGIGAIVFGRSENLVGGENPVAKRAGACARALEEALHIPVHFESEVFTTQEAIREQGRNDLTDASAAAIILNSYLARIRATPHS